MLLQRDPFLTMFYTTNSSPLLMLPSKFYLFWVFNDEKCPLPLKVNYLLKLSFPTRYLPLVSRFALGVVAQFTLMSCRNKTQRQRNKYWVKLQQVAVFNLNIININLHIIRLQQKYQSEFSPSKLSGWPVQKLTDLWNNKPSFKTVGHSPAN